MDHRCSRDSRDLHSTGTNCGNAAGNLSHRHAHGRVARQSVVRVQDPAVVVVDRVATAAVVDRAAVVVDRAATAAAVVVDQARPRIY